MPQTIARRAFELVLDQDWKQFEQELVLSRERFIELNQRFEPAQNAEEAYATMVARLRQGFDKLAASAKQSLGVEEVASRRKNGLEISKVRVMWETADGERTIASISILAVEDRRYVVALA